MTIKWIIYLSIVFMILASCKPQNSIEKSQVKTVSEKVTLAEAVNLTTSAEKNFKTYCSGCHGANANVFVDRKWKHGSDKISLTNSIKNGLIQDGMPAFDTTFSALELDELTDYILDAIDNRSSYTTETIKTPKYYDTKDYQLVIDTIATEADIPWGIKVDAEGTLYFTDKKGNLYLKKKNTKAKSIKGVPEVWNYGQGGLLDIALHPNFVENSIIYLSYSKQKENTNLGTTVLVSAELNEDGLVNIKQLFEALPYVDTRYHFGSRIVFDNNQHMYVSVGDRGKRDEHPQYLTNDCGKIHRFNLDGSIPDDNPFKDENGNTRSVWSYGHRNPQGLIFNSSTNTIWEHEHGPRGGDELNLIQKGKNYGWPTVSFGINYNGTTFTDQTSQDGLIDAKTVWVPSIAPSGMAIIDSPKYPLWKDDILSGSLRFDYISKVTIENDIVVNEERILEGIGRVRSIEMGRDGFLYVGVEEPGRILRVRIVDK